MKIYVVTRGSWEDYGIDKVFSSKEAADNYCNYWNMFEDDDEDNFFSIGEYEDSSGEKFKHQRYARVTFDELDGMYTAPSDTWEESYVDNSICGISLEFSLDITSCNSREDLEKLARETVESKYPHWKEGKI